jgi:hypothetical protein
MLFGMSLADGLQRERGKRNSLVGGGMNRGADAFFAFKEHRGCNIRVASYEVGPQTWIPEACVSLSTDLGARKLWVRSFAHCFASDHITFNNRTEADHWALSAAQAIIDKALPEFNAIALPGIQRTDLRPRPVLRLKCLPVRVFDRFRRLLRGQ